MPSLIHGDQSGCLQSVDPPSKKIQLHSANLPLDCRHRWGGGWVQGCREAAELWRRRGVLALIASHTAKASSCSSRRISISMPGWRREGLYAKQSLLNITKWRETKAKLSQDIRVTYFFNCIPSVYCVYFIPGILLKEKNESFWDQLNVHNICLLLLSFIPVYLM